MGAVESLISPAEATKLAELAATADPETMIVEIGSYKGASAIAMAQAFPGAILCVDVWDEHARQARYQTAKADFYRNVDAAGFGDRLIPFQMPSLRAARVFAEFDKQVGFLFIDGCHHYDYVKADFKAWTPYLAPGARVAFHDYAPDFPYGRGTVRFVEELLAGDGWRADGLVDSLYVLRPA